MMAVDQAVSAHPEKFPIPLYPPQELDCVPDGICADESTIYQSALLPSIPAHHILHVLKLSKLRPHQSS